MKIYVVETIHDYVIQIGFSASKQIAEEQRKEYEKDTNHQAWVTEYTLGKNNWTEFDNG